MSDISQVSGAVAHPLQLDKLNTCKTEILRILWAVVWAVNPNENGENALGCFCVGYVSQLEMVRMVKTVKVVVVEL